MLSQKAAAKGVDEDLFSLATKKVNVDSIDINAYLSSQSQSSGGLFD
jgi:hypothetical protein